MPRTGEKVQTTVPSQDLIGLLHDRTHRSEAENVVVPGSLGQFHEFGDRIGTAGVWQLQIDTADEDGNWFRKVPRPVTGSWHMKPRSVCVFTALYIAENLQHRG